MKIAISGSNHDFIIEATPAENTNEADPQTQKLSCALFLEEGDTEPVDTFDVYYNPRLGPFAAQEAILTTYSSKISHNYGACLRLVFAGNPVLKRAAARVVGLPPELSQHVAFPEGEGFICLDVAGTDERFGNGIQLPKTFFERDIVEIVSMLVTQALAMLRKRMLEARAADPPEILTP